MGELKATFSTGLEVLQCSITIASYDRLPVTRGRLVAEYPLLYGPMSSPPPLRCCPPRSKNHSPVNVDTGGLFLVPHCLTFCALIHKPEDFPGRITVSTG